MHAHFLDPYRPGRGPIHKLDPRIKLILTLAFALVVALTPVGVWPVFVLLFAIALSVVMLSDLGVIYVLKRASLAFWFLLAALPLLFTVEGASLFALPVGAWTITISQPGLERFASIAFKSWVSVQMAIVLAGTTQFPDLLMAMRAIKIPRLLVAIFSLMWRYMFVLVDEMQRLTRARSARSGDSGLPGAKSGGTVAWRARVTGGMAGNLFMRSFERADRIYAAMSARGYNGDVRSLSMPPIPTSHWGVLIGGLFILAALLGLAFLFRL